MISRRNGDKQKEGEIRLENLLEVSDNFYVYQEGSWYKYRNKILEAQYECSLESCNCPAGMVDYYCKHRKFLSTQFKGICKGMSNDVDIYNTLEDFVRVNDVESVGRSDYHTFVHIITSKSYFDLVVCIQKSFSGEFLIALEKAWPESC